MPNFELAARARRDVRYVFHREGGDPCFGGSKSIPMLLHHGYGHVREPTRYVRKILSPKEVRRVGIFDPVRVKQLLDYDTEEGPGRYGLRLWMLMTFEIWRRWVIEREAV